MDDLGAWFIGAVALVCIVPMLVATCFLVYNIVFAVVKDLVD
jgi:hypothetical protein